MTRRGRVLAAATSEGLISEVDAGKLRAAWNFASRTRSALTLWTSKTADVLPTDRAQLEGLARIMGYPPASPRAPRASRVPAHPAKKHPKHSRKLLFRRFGETLLVQPGERPAGCGRRFW